MRAHKCIQRFKENGLQFVSLIKSSCNKYFYYVHLLTIDQTRMCLIKQFLYLLIDGNKFEINYSFILSVESRNQKKILILNCFFNMFNHMKTNMFLDNRIIQQHFFCHLPDSCFTSDQIADSDYLCFHYDINIKKLTLSSKSHLECNQLFLI